MNFLPYSNFINDCIPLNILLYLTMGLHVTTNENLEVAGHWLRMLAYESTTENTMGRRIDIQIKHNNGFYRYRSQNSVF